jgi:hypothetical protein
MRLTQTKESDEDISFFLNYGKCDFESKFERKRMNVGIGKKIARDILNIQKIK